MTIIPKPVKVFTRANPCGKVELWNCFYGPDGFTKRAVVEARGEIGLNAIKYLKQKGYAMDVYGANVDYWELTPVGQGWLRSGLAAHLKRHPEDLIRIKHQEGRPARRRRIIRPA